ncbi:RNA polymerase sigma-70 factor (ECF subfamily) [Brevirhabdus pacifica]|nr:RNA polymerase sigma-70 factor (ECF subfamily) [Brevirhabdus pacifica]
MQDASRDKSDKRTARDGAAAGGQPRSAPADWAALMARVARGDRAAFAEVFRHFAPRVKAYLVKSGAVPALAEDCMQDVMATVWRKAAQFDPARASLAAWIFTIARNRRIDLLRRERRPEAEDLAWGPQAAPEAAEALALQQDAARLARALSDLPEAQRQVIVQAYFGDLSHAQIAARTGLPLGTIKSRTKLALDRLRHAMGRE